MVTAVWPKIHIPTLQMEIDHEFLSLLGPYILARL